MKHIGVFLDRDGTINEEIDFLSSPEELSLIPEYAAAIKVANELGLKVFITTNQSGISRGLLTEERLTEIHKSLQHLLQESDAYVDAIYYCPHHPEIGEEPYRMECECRKPNIGMLTRAANEFDVDLKKSFVIGDRLIDIQTGNNCGAVSILVLTGYGKQELELPSAHDVQIQYIAENLYDAMQYVKRILHHEQHPAR